MTRCRTDGLSKEGSALFQKEINGWVVLFEAQSPKDDRQDETQLVLWKCQPPYPLTCTADCHLIHPLQIKGRKRKSHHYLKLDFEYKSSFTLEPDRTPAVLTSAMPTWHPWFSYACTGTHAQLSAPKYEKINTLEAGLRLCRWNIRGATAV